jgi:hypothetical protein
MQGQCVELYGPGEAYLPVLEALEQACRTGGEQFTALLRQHAPSWLVQMPSLLSLPEREQLQRELGGITRERMLREAARVIEVLTTRKGVVLVLEDLHWSDYSTLDLLAYLARQRLPAHFLLIGTYRPTEVLSRDHPLQRVKQDLQVHGYCQELALEPLTQDNVAAYLNVRFAANVFPTTFAQRLHQQTDGNPLFTVSMVEYLLERNAIVQQGETWELRGEVDAATATVPKNIGQFIEHVIAQLSPEEQQVLEAASVAGLTFSAAAVAAAVIASVEEVEQLCDRLARRKQFLQASGSSAWPDGTIAAQYTFLHTLYRTVLYERVPSARHAHWHRQIGEREEAGYREHADNIAAELALHFEQVPDYERAVRYRRQAGQTALRQHAYREAIHHFTHGIRLLAHLPETPESAQQELLLQTALGTSLIAVKGFGDPGIEQIYTRAQELCRQFGDIPQLSSVLTGLWASYLVRADLRTARQLAEQSLHLAQSGEEQALLLRAHNLMAASLHFSGELTAALAYLQQVIATASPQQLQSQVFFEGQAAPIVCRSIASWVLWTLGYPHQALIKSHEALRFAHESSLPFMLAMAHNFAAVVYSMRREGRAAQKQAEAGIRLATEYELDFCKMLRAEDK